MTTDEIFESGFVTAFIREYFDSNNFDFENKDRLLYALCLNESEKNEVTKEQIKVLKHEIKSLGFEDLSFAYLLSSKPDHPDYIQDYDKRIEYWLNKFSTYFRELIISFFPACYFEKNNLDNLDEIDLSLSDYFPQNIKPKFNTIKEFEALLNNEINDIINDYQVNGYWEFYFDDLTRFSALSKPLQTLYDLSDLFVKLDRLLMFQSFMNNSTTISEHPFKDDTTAELFEYIVTNWSYNKQQKWADIFITINDLDGYAIPYKNEYQVYIIQRFGYTGKFQYDKPKGATNRHKIELMELIKNFSKK
jgi:hypothetical protein